jgi:Holliday junction resolvase RusA-like endonuclease
MQIQFFVHGKPQPGGSKKGFVNPKTGRVVILDDAKHNASWRERVVIAAKEAHTGPPLDGPLVVAMEFFFLRPKGHFGAGKKADQLKPFAPGRPSARPDVLKLARSTEDALTGHLWHDDSQTVRLLLDKSYGPIAGARITVTRFGGGS